MFISQRESGAVLAKLKAELVNTFTDPSEN